MAATTFPTASEPLDGDHPLGLSRFLLKDVSIEQQVELPDVDYARNGTRKGSSRAATRLGTVTPPCLTPPARDMLADVVTDIDRVIDVARNHALTARRAANVELGQVVGRVLATCVLVVSNDRVGHVALTPLKSPTQAWDGEQMLAEAERVVDSYDALRRAVHETIRHTLTLGGEYAESIVSAGVIDPVMVRLTRIHLVKENVHFTVLEPFDGATRTVHSLAALLNTKNAEKITQFVLDSFFDNHVDQNTAPEPLDITEDVRNSLRVTTRGVLNDYWSRRAASGELDPAALRIRQALTMPAEFTLTVAPHGPQARTYIEGIDVLVRNTHVNRRNWEAAAEASNLARTVATALIEEDLLTDAEQDLLLARTSKECATALEDLGTGYVEGDVDPALWRAVGVLNLFTRPSIEKAAKRAIGQALNLTQIRNQRYAAVLSTLVDQPWRETKHASARQAHRAWVRGGALTRDMIGFGSWEIAHTANAADLIKRTDRDARLTLAGLGGTALIADRFMTADAVAGVGDGGAVRMPYKVSLISNLVEMLARDENAGGREQLSLAASTFDPNGESSSAWRDKERQERQANLGATQIANAQAQAAGRPGDVMPLPVYYRTPLVGGGELNAVDLMKVADYDNALSDKAGTAARRKSSRKPTAKTPLELVSEARVNLQTALDDALEGLGTLRTLAIAHKMDALDAGGYQAANEVVQHLWGQMYSLQPRTDTGLNVDGDEPGDADDEEFQDDLDGTSDLDLDEPTDLDAHDLEDGEVADPATVQSHLRKLL